MNTLVISDIHLGSPLVNISKVTELLKSDRYEKIILNGDIFDVWEETFYNIMIFNFTFIQNLKNISLEKPVYYVIGNHDPRRIELEREFPNIIFSDKLILDNDIMFIHGHEFDDLVTKYSLIAKLMFLPNWICERIFLFNLKAFFRELFYSISNKKNKPYFNELVNDVEKKAIETYKNECKYLVMGHTHTPKIVGGACTYINCGDIIHNKVCIEYDENKNFRFIKG